MSTLLSTSFRLLFNRFVLSPSLKKQTHCLQLEENSSDVAQWEELIVNLEAALRSIGHLVSLLNQDLRFKFLLLNFGLLTGPILP